MRGRLLVTPKSVVRHNTRPLTDRRPPKVLGDRFFTSAVTMVTQGKNVITAKDSSDEDRNKLPPAASGMTGGMTISRPRGEAQLGERTSPKKESISPKKTRSSKKRNAEDTYFGR